eukprot:TRINITY_DN45779_c0_g1_i4.p2 TRINITY_DN45779_c0_g1~~TRINITY_DN45779_c0_g1_i4.p2  ORF type:complete len:474 (-),score=75.77 TRINITY_DN45779_c0_g1_i4:1215-2636(-)
MSSRYPILLWVAVLGGLFGSIQFGYHQGVLNTAWHQLADVFGYYDVKSWYTSVINFSYLIGAAVGALGAGSVADITGPKKALLINCILFIIGGLISTFSIVGKIGVIMFSVGRFVSGIGAGTASLVAPRFITEISPIHLRGVIGTMNQVFICFGILFAYLAGLPYETMANDPPKNEWRFLLLLSVIIPAIQIVILLFVPESFEWLRMQGDTEKANKAGETLHGDLFIEFEVKDPLLKGQDQDEQIVSLSEMFSRKYSLFMSLGIAVVVFQQLSGINTVVMYSTTVFKQVNLDNAVLGSVITGLINVAGTLVAAALVENAGRKVLLLVSHAGMFICLGYITVLQWLPIQQGSETAAYSSFAAIVIYVIFFAIGCGPIPWLYLAEMMPSQIKGKAAAIATSLNWTFCIVIIAAFPLMLKGLGTGVSYGIFAIFNVVAFIYLAFFMVETKQISTKEIEKKLLRDDAPITAKEKSLI